MAWHTWSNISTGKDRAGRPIITPTGEEVTPGKLGLTLAQFDELIEAKAVRQEPYPHAIVRGSTLSPTEYMRRQIAVADGVSDASVLSDAEVVRIPDYQVPPSPAQIVVPSAIPGVVEPGEPIIGPMPTTPPQVVAEPMEVGGKHYITGGSEIETGSSVTQTPAHENSSLEKTQQESKPEGTTQQDVTELTGG